MSNDTRLTLCDVRGPLDDLHGKLAGEGGVKWLAALKKFLRKENPWDVPLFRYDKREDGWELLEGADEPAPEGNIVPPLEVVPFLQEGENYISGNELIRRDRGKFHCNLGQRYAEWLLEHQDQIPKELREYYLLFTRTIWREFGTCDYYNMPVLYCGADGKWKLTFPWLIGDYSGRGRLVRPRKSA